jgi:hypothetical protein
MYDFQRHIAPLFLELRRIAGEGAMQALIAVGLDHATRTPKPWTYYLGVGVGGAAIASGIPNASLDHLLRGQRAGLADLQEPGGWASRCLHRRDGSYQLHDVCRKRNLGERIR